MLNAIKVSIPNIIPSTIILFHNPSAKSPFLLSTGFRFIISFSGGSKPIAIAGSESVTKFTHNNCIANKGDLNPNTNPINMVTISPMFVAIKK